jgi:UDP-N-acetylglucosamine acyltransferase
MPTIHSTALVDPAAQLASDVEVGPGAIIESGAVIGEGCRIQARAVITGHVRMGARNIVGYGAIIGADPQDFSFKPGTPTYVEIGDDNVIREYATIHRATKEAGATRIGNNNFLMVGVHMGHDSSVANRVVMANNVLLAGHVEVQDGAVLGGGSVFHQFIRVGRLCMVRGGERFGMDIPPYLVAYGTNLVAGLNAIGLKRAGFSPETRKEIRKAFQLLYREGRNVSQALEEAKGMTWSPEVQSFWEFVAAAKRRGICSPESGGRTGCALSSEE